MKGRKWSCQKKTRHFELLQWHSEWSLSPDLQYHNMLEWHTRRGIRHSLPSMYVTFAQSNHNTAVDHCFAIYMCFFRISKIRSHHTHVWLTNRTNHGLQNCKFRTSPWTRISATIPKARHAVVCTRSNCWRLYMLPAVSSPFSPSWLSRHSQTDQSCSWTGLMVFQLHMIDPSNRVICVFGWLPFVNLEHALSMHFDLSAAFGEWWTSQFRDLQPKTLRWWCYSRLRCWLRAVARRSNNSEGPDQASCATCHPREWSLLPEPDIARISRGVQYGLKQLCFLIFVQLVWHHRIHQCQPLLMYRHLCGTHISSCHSIIHDCGNWWHTDGAHESNKRNSCQCIFEKVWSTGSK